MNRYQYNPRHYRPSRFWNGTRALDADAVLQVALAEEPQLRVILFRHTRNWADAEDLLQELYGRLLTHKPVPIDNVRAYVRQAARLLAIDWIRHRKIVPIDLVADVCELETLDDGPFVDEIVSTHQTLERISAAVQGLPPRQRAAFVLRKVYEYPQKEIAQRLGITENTVEQLLQHAARRLALILGSQL